MKKNIVILSAAILIGFCFYSCKKNQTTTVAQHNLYYQYFPLKKGDSIIYKVDSFKYNVFTNIIDSFHYFVLQYVQDTLTDDQGRLTYRLNRLWKTIPKLGVPDSAWVQGGVWREQIANNYAQTIEENIRYARLVFPVANGTHWNGNRFNNIDTNNWYDYNYAKAFKPWVGTYKSYDSTVTINQISHYDFIYRISGHEVYAANIGLVYKQFKYADYSQFQVDTTQHPYDTTGITGYGVIQTIYYCSYHK